MKAEVEMRKIRCALLFLLLAALLAACGKNVEKQVMKQMELGQRYLEEEDYEAALVAFNKVIELDPKTWEAYEGLVNVYEAQENYSDALAALGIGLDAVGYENISDDDQTWVVERYLAWAEMDEERGDYDSAQEILEQGYEKTGDESILEMLNELNEGNELIVWDDAVFEELVREKLSLEGDVYVRDLDEVTELVILGNTHVIVNGDLEDWWFRHLSVMDQEGELIQNGMGILTAFYGIGEGDEAERYTEKGDIHSVNALKYFRNLKSVLIIANHIEDISVISDLDLGSAVFFANDISDLSPLYSFKNYDYNGNEQFVEIGDVLAK